MEIEKVPSSPPPAAPETTTKNDGFLSELKSVMTGSALTSSADALAKPDVAASNTPKVTEPVIASTSHENASAEVNQGNGYEINFSFYLRISGTINSLGKEASDTFHTAAKTVAQTFLKTGGWSGDPMGSFLKATESVIAQGSNQTQHFLQRVVTGKDQGLSGIAALLDEFAPTTDQPPGRDLRIARITKPTMAEATTNLLLRRNYLRPIPFTERETPLSLQTGNNSSISAEFKGTIHLHSHASTSEMNSAAQTFLTRFVAFLDTVERRAGAATDQAKTDSGGIPVNNPCLPSPSPNLTINPFQSTRAS